MQELEIFAIDIWRWEIRERERERERSWSVTPTNIDNCNVLNTHYTTLHHANTVGKMDFIGKLYQTLGQSLLTRK